MNNCNQNGKKTSLPKSIQCYFDNVFIKMVGNLEKELNDTFRLENKEFNKKLIQKINNYVEKNNEEEAKDFFLNHYFSGFDAISYMRERNSEIKKDCELSPVDVLNFICRDYLLSKLKSL